MMYAAGAAALSTSPYYWARAEFSAGSVGKERFDRIAGRLQLGATTHTPQQATASHSLAALLHVVRVSLGAR